MPPIAPAVIPCGSSPRGDGSGVPSDGPGMAAVGLSGTPRWRSCPASWGPVQDGVELRKFGWRVRLGPTLLWATAAMPPATNTAAHCEGQLFDRRHRPAKSAPVLDRVRPEEAAGHAGHDGVGDGGHGGQDGKQPHMHRTSHWRWCQGTSRDDPGKRRVPAPRRIGTSRSYWPSVAIATLRHRPRHRLPPRGGPPAAYRVRPVLPS